MNLYEQNVLKAIKRARPDIGEVVQLISVRNVLFSRELYPEVVAAVKKWNFGSIPEPVYEKGSFREYLDVSVFQDAAGNRYFVTIYDSDELLQDPEVLDLWEWDAQE